MAIRAEDVRTELTLIERAEGTGPQPKAVPAGERRDYRLLYEREVARGGRSRSPGESGRSASRRVSLCGGQDAFRIRFLEASVRAFPEEADESRRADEGNPGHGEQRAVVAGIAAPERHDQVAAHGTRRAAQGGDPAEPGPHSAGDASWPARRRSRRPTRKPSCGFTKRTFGFVGS